MLPKLSRKEVDRLIAELQDAQFRLESTPATTIEFVKSLTFLDDIQVRVSLVKVILLKKCFKPKQSTRSR